MITAADGYQDVPTVLMEQGDQAMFNKPHGLVRDKAGNLYAANFGSYAIRKMTVEGTNGLVSTIAGLAGSANWRDDFGADARF
ncbi:MAG: hypothetical protein KGJ60_03620 [Verrucomicrobiota bacterium]|nr:hypothetical protein [Verrucomicrobiota bacterium]